MIKKLLIFLFFLGFSFSALAFAAETGEVTEISFARAACYGRCPVYTVTLKSNGRASYEGEKYVERTGKYKASFDPAAFQKLVKLLNENEFFRLKKLYETSASDLPSTYVSVVRSKKRKTVRNYGDSGPFRLHEIETAIDEMAEKLAWEEDEE